MMKHSIKEDVLHLSIDKKDFSYRIPVKKLGNSIDWKVGNKESKGIIIKNVSTWTLQLFTKKVTEDKYIKQFVKLIQDQSPKNNINWDDTLLAVNIQNNYNWLVEKNKTAEEKLSEEEIILSLKKKYKID